MLAEASSLWSTSCNLFLIRGKELMAGKRILVVCMLDSIHTARWLKQFQNEDLDFMLFPSSPQRRFESLIKALIKNDQQAPYRRVPLVRFFGAALWFLDRFVNNYFRAAVLNASITHFRPSILHGLEPQNAGYVTSKYPLVTSRMIPNS